MLFSRGELQGVEVRVWNTKILRLTSTIWSHRDVPFFVSGSVSPLPTSGMAEYSRRTVCATRESGIDACAECRLAFLAVAASAVGDVERDHDAVTRLQERDSLSNVLNDAHILVS
jgi:hypothetical protein